ncbi:MAG TPA: carbohydrate porin [Thermodesulfobacteriota bacterium]|nr:carbohydrate porin [Thermodesulfobacteriota bacterium]
MMEFIYGKILYLWTRKAGCQDVLSKWGRAHSGFLVLFFLFPLLNPFPSQSQETPQSWNIHGQTTAITQAHGGFHSPYEGPNSFRSKWELHTVSVSTLFLGKRLWPGGEFYVNPELAMGRGLSDVLGIAGFPNGEATRVTKENPTLYLARLFLRQTWNLGGGEEVITDSPNFLAGKRSKRRLALTAGNFAATDLFDDNLYSPHDPSTHFFNWGLMNAGAWDFPADTRGYTWGFALDFTWDRWSARWGSFLVSTSANGLNFDMQITQARGDVAEIEHRHLWGEREGAVRFLLFMNQAFMGSYRESLNLKPQGPNIEDTRQPGRKKYGWTISAQQEVIRDLGTFLRVGWNDGKTESWMFTEIDRSLAWGVSLGGRSWDRPLDRLGLAIMANGLSQDHREYLAAGGLGFMLGDGRLNYAPEGIVEGYYAFTFFNEATNISLDVQRVWNPGYNHDRGPVTIFGLRLNLAI